MNNVILTGRFTRDPEVRYSQGEQPSAIARFTLAVDRRGKQGEADFISCVAFGKTAEFIEKYFKKGSKINLQGRIQTGSYTNKDGNKVYTTDVIAEQVEFGESKGSGSAAPANNTTGNKASEPAADDGFTSIPDGIEDELPFN